MKKSQNWRNHRFFLIFCLLIESHGSVHLITDPGDSKTYRSGSIQIIKDPDPRGPKTYGSGSVQIITDPDPGGPKAYGSRSETLPTLLNFFLRVIPRRRSRHPLQQPTASEPVIPCCPSPSGWAPSPHPAPPPPLRPHPPGPATAAPAPSTAVWRGNSVSRPPCRWQCRQTSPSRPAPALVPPASHGRPGTVQLIGFSYLFTWFWTPSSPAGTSRGASSSCCAPFLHLASKSFSL